MQVPGDFAKGPASPYKLLHRKIKEFFLIRLQMNLAAGLQYPAVNIQLALMGKAAGAVPLLRPGITEIQVYPLHLAFAEILLQLLGVHRQKPQVS
ncbi:hypothetical protein SDC9_168467 [bioreactor metagenome]|uniref:Uncharacterized protein n=1 Tax=bioreactor metagenome TaxID=1076179 RepID=A0A645G2L9_9ZZZZ